MRAITVCQPYAHLIASGSKLVENRKWPTRYRGPLLIHAGKSREWLDIDETGTMDESYGIRVADLAFGAIVAVAKLVDCLPIMAIRRGQYDEKYPWLNDHDHTEGPFCWVLQNVRRLPEPIKHRGALGLHEVPDSVVGSVNGYAKRIVK